MRANDDHPAQIDLASPTLTQDIREALLMGKLVLLVDGEPSPNRFRALREQCIELTEPACPTPPAPFPDRFPKPARWLPSSRRMEAYGKTALRRK